MKAATVMQRTQPINIIRNLGLKTIIAIDKDEIPVTRSKGKSTMYELQVVRDFNEMLDHINKNGLNPCEIAAELNVAGADIEVERKRRKSFSQSFRKLLRKSVKEHSLDNQLEVREFDNGSRYFIVGRSA
jgi:hypothetical protein